MIVVYFNVMFAARKEMADIRINNVNLIYNLMCSWGLYTMKSSQAISRVKIELVLVSIFSEISPSLLSGVDLLISRPHVGIHHIDS
jgi:hypothetical protein